MAHDVREVLIVEVAGRRFGLPGEMVRELLRAVLITPLPRSQHYVEGVISIRGEVAPVLDLRHWLGLPARPVEPADLLVVVRAGQNTAVLRVDCALELVHLEVPLAAGGVVQLAQGLIVVPDLTGLLAHAGPIASLTLQPRTDEPVASLTLQPRTDEPIASLTLQPRTDAPVASLTLQPRTEDVTLQTRTGDVTLQPPSEAVS